MLSPNMVVCKLLSSLTIFLICFYRGFPCSVTMVWHGVVVHSSILALGLVIGGQAHCQERRRGSGEERRRYPILGDRRGRAGADQPVSPCIYTLLSILKHTTSLYAIVFSMNLGLVLVFSLDAFLGGSQLY